MGSAVPSSFPPSSTGGDMAQFDGSSKQGKKSYESGESQSRQWFSTQHLPALSAGLVIVGLFVGAEACSRKSGNATTGSSRPAISAPAPTTAPAAANLPAATPVAKKIKKVHRQRASIITYANNDYGVSLRYPRKYDLKLGDEAQVAWPGVGQLPSAFLKTGGVTVAAVAMPGNSYPETDFASAFINLSVNSGLTAEECMQFAVTGKDGAGNDPAGTDPAKIQIGKLEFREVEKVTAQDIKQADVKYYHAYQNRACYEFALGVGTSSNSTGQDIPQVDRSAVFAKLERILASVQFKPVEVPITAAPADSLSNMPNNPANTPPADSAPAAVPSAIPPAAPDRT
jgi:hypothetical protein